MSGTEGRPLKGHELLRWKQTTMIDSRWLPNAIDAPRWVFGCSCGERSPYEMETVAMWFIGHLFTVLGAEYGDGFGRVIDDDEAQQLWFSADEVEGP